MIVKSIFDAIVLSFPGVPAEKAESQHDRGENGNDDVPEHFRVEHGFIGCDGIGNFRARLFYHQVNGCGGEGHPQNSGKTLYRIHV